MKLLLIFGQLTEKQTFVNIKTAFARKCISRILTLTGAMIKMIIN